MIVSKVGALPHYEWFPVFYAICFCLANLQIDQKITELVSEQQKTDAKRTHDKSEIEQLKQDITNAHKQKKLISKALENKVFYF